MGSAVSDVVKRVQAMAEKARAKSEENRKKMPAVAAFVDEMKAAFGADQVRVTFASENGVQLGTPDTERGIKLSDCVIGDFSKKEKGRKV